MYCELNVLVIRQLIQAWELNVLCIRWSVLPYVMYHTKSDIEGFVCIFVIVNSLTNMLSGFFTVVLLPNYALFYWHERSAFQLVGVWAVDWQRH